MASYLVDTNVWLRSVDPGSPEHEIAVKCLAQLRENGDEVFLSSQNLIEFRAVATRPAAANGLGWSIEEAKEEIEELRQQFPVLAERVTCSGNGWS